MLAPKSLKLPDTTNCATGCLQTSDKYSENMTNMQENMTNMQENIAKMQENMTNYRRYVIYM
jgi:hypothetical protein